MKRIAVALPVLLLVGCAANPSRWLRSAPADDQSKPSAPAQSGDDASLSAIKLAYKKYVLPNGLTLVVHENHQSPVVALDVCYHVGSKDEPDGRHGFAHLFEHLMFKGSEHDDSEYLGATGPAGATDASGDTDYDRTSFSETVPAASVDLALWLESERMSYLPAGIDQSRLDQQRGLVEKEKQQSEGQPFGGVDAVIARTAYPAGHPYSWTPLGSIHDLQAASLDDVRNWFERYYGAANATLVISGDVDADAIRKTVEHYFGDIAAGPPVSHVTAWPARMTGERRSTMQADVPQARLYMVWNLPPAFNADTTRLQLAADLLADGKDSRLYRRLVQGGQLASDVSAEVDEHEIGSQLVIQADARPGVSLDRIEQAVDEELAKLLANGPQPPEIDRARTNLLARLVRRLQPVSGQAEMLARSEVFGGSPDAYKRYLDDLRQAGPNDVRDSLRNWLADGVFVLDVQPAARHQNGSGTHPQRPAVGSAASLNLPALQRTTLANGMKVVLAQRGGAPLVDFDMLFQGGRASDADLPDGTAALTFKLLDSGTDHYSAADIDSRLQTLGASVHSHIGADAGDLQLSALNGRIAPALDLYADLIRKSTFPADEIARLKQQTLTGIEQQRSSPRGVIDRVLPRLLFGAGHPYAHVGLGLPEQVQAIQRADIAAYAKRWLRPDNATLLVTGDIDMAVLKPLLQARFGDWKASSVPVTRVDVPSVPPPAGPRVFLIDQPGATQSMVVVASLAPPPSDPAQPAFETVDAALGGDFGSRLNVDLRQTRQWSDGAFSGQIPMRFQQIFYAGAPVQVDKTAESIADIRSQIEGLVDGQPPLSEAEIDAAKQSEVRDLLGDNQTLDEIAGSIRTALTLDLPDDYYDRFVGRVESLTPGQLQNAAQRLINPQALTWVVVGDLSKIEAPVRALNLGSVQVIDADGRPVSP